MVTNFIALIMKSFCSSSLSSIEKINKVLEGESKFTCSSC
jgi:transposase-like protein